MWAGKERSWEKLAMLTDWLRNEGTRSAAYWVVEGHLQLAEGRAHFASYEPEHRETRRSAASAGFHTVLAHDSSTASQLQRARMGLADLQGGAFPKITNTALPGILPRQTWGAARPNMQRLDPATSPWRWVTIHHSAEPGAKPLDGSMNSSAAALRDIQSAHMGGEGYGDVGYHFLIDPAGRTFQGRDLRYQGAHAGGQNNVGNIGICLLGNFETQRPTAAAVEAMHRLVDLLRGRFSIGPTRVCGHNHWRSTACPGRYLLPELARYSR